jgi:hypothetical protein
LAGTPNKHALHGIADNFSGNAARPADCRPIKAFTGPPLGITSRGVHCGLETARQGLTELVAGHEQALAVRGTCSMKVQLFRVRLVVLETILS